ncbi:thioesterase family protein [Aeromicrobium ginsengisoli]|uniref:Thioesterase family protein n=1 Tax=Aeromicrobium ginsengisoli TaxID=363867 RepID=A0A5M4FG32_9ACTN|nr:thioesterase family protein [Aeromicrobium ginsengisoli]KAA1398120.1 thioesterase family protein [Aeromicrobium ginsengisoli]
MDDDIYDIDTSSVPRGDGIRDLTLTDRWNTPLGKPNGGYILAAMLRGLGDEMAADDAMVGAVTYLASPETGAAELRTTTLRRGRRVQTGEAALWEGDRHIAQLLASFGARTGRSIELGTPPDLPAPDDCINPKDFPDAMPASTIFDRVDYRLGAAPGWALGQPSGDPTFELWQRLAGGREIDLPALAFLCDSYAPPVLEIGAAQSMTVQLTVHLHRRPEPGWIATRLTTRHVINGFHEEDCELWDEAGNLVAQSRQLAMLL